MRHDYTLILKEILTIKFLGVVLALTVINKKYGSMFKVITTKNLSQFSLKKHYKASVMGIA